MIMRKLFEIAKDEYSLKEGQEFEPLNDKKRRMLKCQILMEELERKGALDSEKERLLLYMAVLVNAEKEKLDWMRAHYDLNIDDLFNFYIY